MLDTDEKNCTCKLAATLDRRTWISGSLGSEYSYWGWKSPARAASVNMCNGAASSDDGWAFARECWLCHCLLLFAL